MFIGEVSKKTGLSIKAIRLYEEMGLIKTPRRQGRYRVYQPIDIEVLNLISQAKQLGIKLAELKGVIVYKEDQLDWQRVEKLLIEVKARLLHEQHLITEKLKNVESCMDALNSCHVGLDSAPKGRA